MNTEDFTILQEDFLATARKNLQPQDEEEFSDVIQEALWQVSDWYNNESYYGKPEDILQDYFFLTAEQAHKYLPIFIEHLRGNK